MSDSIGIYKIHEETFRVNNYSSEPFRAIGLIDVSIIFKGSIEVVTLPYYRSSGTNSGKLQGLWYPIVGIKLRTGRFTEFTPYINLILTIATDKGRAKRGWLAKSLFFEEVNETRKMRGFSSGRYYESLLLLGERLRELYENGEYTEDTSLTPDNYDRLIVSGEIYNKNKRSQRENFEEFIQEIFKN